MGRRRKSNAADDIVDAVALLPWWAGVVLAVTFYLVLHHVAERPVAAVTQPGLLADTVGQSMLRALATFGQYVLPLLCLMGAAVSAWRRRDRQRLVDQAAARPAASAVDGMTWQQFERLVGEAFRQQGYKVFENGGGGADGGIDLVLARDGETFLVQCKQWRALRVGVDVVRELYGVMAAKGAAGGFVVTSGRFTDEARDFALGRNVQLIDGLKLHLLIQLHRERPSVHPSAAHAPEAPVMVPPLHPTCPRCSKAMIKRVARKGANAGSEFWGCPGWPQCKGTRPL